MGSCAFQCDVPHQWIAQRQVGPVSVYCDGVGCHVLCLRHGISECQHIGQSTTATSRHRCDMTGCLKAMLHPNKQTNSHQAPSYCCDSLWLTYSLPLMVSTSLPSLAVQTLTSPSHPDETSVLPSTSEQHELTDRVWPFMTASLQCKNKIW